MLSPRLLLARSNRRVPSQILGGVDVAHGPAVPPDKHAEDIERCCADQDPQERMERGADLPDLEVVGDQLDPACGDQARCAEVAGDQADVPPLIPVRPLPCARDDRNAAVDCDCAREQAPQRLAQRQHQHVPAGATAAVDVHRCDGQRGHDVQKCNHEGEVWECQFIPGEKRLAAQRQDGQGPICHTVVDNPNGPIWEPVALGLHRHVVW